LILSQLKINARDHVLTLTSQASVITNSYSPAFYSSGATIGHS
jgi:hypothetical protein